MGGENGWEFFDGAGSHLPNADGFDGIAYNRRTGETILYDNKDFLGRLRGDGTRGPAYVGSSRADALTRNLEHNLEEAINRLERAAPAMHPEGRASLEKVLNGLREARTALKTGHGWPGTVSLAITNAGGDVARISPKLERAGIKFIDARLLRLVGKPTKEGRLALRSLRKLLRKATSDAELDALKKLAARRAREVAEKKAAKSALGKAIDKTLLRLGAGRAAKRASQLIPFVGAGFAVPDAYAGMEDILRGHTARGLAGIGMAVGDVAAQFLNIGDAVSGVGGTMLDVAAQGVLAAGQLALAMDRAKEKMEELQQEIERRGLPDDRRLRDEFGLDDEAIQDLRQSLQSTEPATEPTPQDLPDEPSWPHPLEYQVPGSLLDLNIGPARPPTQGGSTAPPRQPAVKTAPKNKPVAVPPPAPSPIQPSWSPSDLIC
jgi:hypothetical protein